MQGDPDEYWDFVKIQKLQAKAVAEQEATRHSISGLFSSCLNNELCIVIWSGHLAVFLYYYEIGIAWMYVLCLYLW